MTDLCQGPNPDVPKPRLAVPAGATDTHFHLFGPQTRYPYQAGREYTPPDASAETARRVFDVLGIQRCVVIQPSVYGADNRCQLEQGAAIGLPMRAIVVTARDISDTELDRLDELGARGVRFTLAHAGALDPADIEFYADRMKELGWHIQFMVKPHQLVELEARLARLSCSVVIDHMAMVKPAEGLAQPAFQALLRLVKAGHTWVKFTGAYRLSGQQPSYGELAPFSRTLVTARPDRIVWGSDWPHVALKGQMPNTTDLLDLLGDWASDAILRRRILVDNPAVLYGFP
jgi:predicted TIM-barrel fold metal-dependent hydrolase